MLQKYQQIIGTLNFWLFICLIAVLPYSHGLIRPLWVAWLIGWALELRWLNRPDFSKERRLQQLPLFGILVWFVWEFASGLYSADIALTWSILGRHINLLAVLVISIFGVNERYKASTLLRALIITSVISVGFYLMMHFWIDNRAASVSDEWRPDTQLDWLHMENLTYAMKHRLYYAVLLVFSLISIVFLLPEHIRKYGRWQAISLSCAAALILLAGIWWSGSRICMVCVVALIGIWAIWHTAGRKKWLTGAGFALALAALAWGALTFYPRFAGQSKEAIFAFDASQEEPSFEPRVAIWHAALESPQDYLAVGIGAGCSKAYMTEKYAANGWTRLAERQYSPHNQFLTECIELGIVASLLFLLLWLAMPFCHKGRAREFTLYACATVMLCMLTESMLDRIEGVLFLCVVLLLISQLDMEKA